MIKDGKVIPIPDVPLGRLAKRLETADRSVYPIKRYVVPTEHGHRFGDSITEDTPGAVLWDQFDSPEEELADWAQFIRSEHADVTDERLKEHPGGCFHGRGRNSRWHDEYERRGL